MPRTVQSYLDSIQHKLGATMDSRHAAIDMLNDAGRFLFRMHQWQWRQRPLLEITLPEGDTSVPLPADFGELIELTVPNGVIYNVEQVTLGRINQLRAYGQFTASLYYAAVVYPSQASPELAPDPPRLEVYPPADASGNDTISFSINYLAAWIDCNATDTAAVPNVPRDFERLLLELARAMAAGIEDDSEIIETPSVQQQLQRLMAADGLVQATGGPMQGGAADQIINARGYIYPHRRVSRSL